MPPTTARKKRSKPRFLADCRVQFQQKNGRLVSGVVTEILSLEKANGVTYKVQCHDDDCPLRLAQSQLRFAPESPVWVQTREGSKPGVVVAYHAETKKYRVTMLADEKVVGGIPGKLLRYNALQAVIQKEQEALIIKQEAQEQQQQQQQQQQQSLANTTSNQAARTRAIVKEEVQQEEARNENRTSRVPDAGLEIVTIEDSDDEEDEEDTQSKQMSLEELLEIRRRNLPRNFVLNETSNKFWSILYSPKHNVQEAVQCIRKYIDTYGASTRPKMNGGIGPVLYQRCLYWHLQGQCKRKGCKFQDDHVELVESEAMDMEAALEPATSKHGPIYPPEVVLAIEKEDEPDNNNQQESITVVHPPPAAVAPGRQDPRQRLQQQRQERGNTAVPLCRDPRLSHTLESTENADRRDPRQRHQRDDTTAPKRRRTFQCQEQISVLLPAEFGEGFYRGALATPEARKAQKEHGCEWKLECRRNRTTFVVRGDSYDRMEESQRDIQRVLCRNLPRELRGKLLWDLSRLAHRNEQDFLAVDGPMLEEEAPTIWMTVIPLTMNYVPNQSLCVRDARDFADRLGAAYGPRLGENACFVAVHLADHARDFGSVPSHIVLWSRDRRTAANLRRDFFREGDNMHQDSEEECW